MNKIDFLTQVKDWYEGKFGKDPVEQAKKVAEAHIEDFVKDKYGAVYKSTHDLFKNHFHLSSTVSSIQSIVSDLAQKVESLLPQPVANPDIGAPNAE